MQVRLLTFLCVLFGLCVALPDADNFENLGVSRFVDLTQASIVRESIAVRIQAKASAVSTYFLAFPQDVASKLAAVHASATAEKSDNQQVDCVVKKAELDASSGVLYYSVQLPKALNQGEKLDILINLAFTHLLKPLPAELDQFPKDSSDSTRQRLMYSGYAYFMSPYSTRKETTSVRLAGSSTESYSSSPSPVNKAGSSITYGPYEGVASLSDVKSARIHIHYENTDAILVSRTYRRIMEVSHWGSNLAVEEHYDLHHEGAKLKGHFSRVDYSRSFGFNRDSNMVKSLKITLPKGAHGVYFKDTVGNVSTSNFRNERTQSLLEIRPRYPLYGGWRYSWFHGYNAPLKDFLRYDSQKYVLQVPFLGGLKNISIDQAQVKIILPEGACSVKVHLPFEVDSIVQSRHFTYLDTLGRPTIVFNKENVADEYDGPIQISYSYPFYMLLLKPLVVSAFLLGMYLFCMVCVRLDLSITKDPELESRLLLDSFTTKAHHVNDQLAKVYVQLHRQFEQHKQTKSSVDQYKSARADLEKRHSNLISELEKIAKAAEAQGGDAIAFSSTLCEIITLHKEQVGKMKGMFTDVIKFVGSSEAKDDAKRKQVMDGMSKSQSEMEQTKITISELFDKL